VPVLKFSHDPSAAVGMTNWVGAAIMSELKWPRAGAGGECFGWKKEMGQARKSVPQSCRVAR
jgi:hypothetical protein